jgi:hypothetical protein
MAIVHTISLVIQKLLCTCIRLSVGREASERVLLWALDAQIGAQPNEGRGMPECTLYS